MVLLCKGSSCDALVAGGVRGALAATEVVLPGGELSLAGGTGGGGAASTICDEGVAATVA